MAAVLVPGLRADRFAKIRRVRELPMSGNLLVKVGDRVNPDTTVAKAELPGELLVLRLPELMGLQVFEVASALKVKIGAVVTRNQLLAEFAGLFGLLKTRFFSPDAGTIEFFSERTGHLGLRKAPWPIELKAYLSGVVIASSPGRSVSIESDCSFVQGIFGLGGERFGKLKVIAQADQNISADLVPDSCPGTILVGGRQPDIEAVRKAVSAGAVGFVTGSLDDTLIKAYLGYDLGIAITGDEKVPMTLIMTEGFGQIAMSQRAFKLLQECDGLTASINGATQVRAGAVRPEIIIAREVEGCSATSNLAQGLTVGCKVRVIRVPYFGQIGEVLDLPVKAQTIETGARARVVKLRLDSNNTVIVPRANVELV